MPAAIGWAKGNGWDLYICVGSELGKGDRGCPEAVGDDGQGAAGDKANQPCENSGKWPCM